MEDNVQAILEKEQRISKNDLILLGVSGGPDSMCMLHLVHALGYRLAVGHLDHGLRPSADQDAAVVQAFSKTLGVDFYQKKVDTNQFAQEQGMSIEEAARTLRYQFLSETAMQVSAKALAVAHTADDQVETVLMHLLRGAGLAGLRGMQVWSVNPYHQNHAPIIRPLLSVWREDVLAYCEKYQLEPVFDESNQDTMFYRNKLRHDLIPLLAEYNPKVKEIVHRMADSLGADFEALSIAVDKAWEDCLVHTGQNAIALDVKSFSGYPLGLQRGLTRKAINHLRPGLRDIDFAAVERFLNFVDEPPQSAKADLIAGLDMMFEEDEVWLLDKGTDLPFGDWPQLEDEEITLSVPGKVQLANGWWIKAEKDTVGEEKIQEILENQSLNTAWLSVDVDTVTVRRKKNGDRFQPLGMEGHSLKLSDFFINIKLPKRARGAWPLVCVEDQIAWVVGQRPAEPFRVSPSSDAGIKLTLEK